MDAFTDLTETSLLELVSQGDERAFETIYTRYAARLFGYAASRIHNPDNAEEIIQEIFLWLWEKRESATNIKALKPYLYSAVRNKIAERIAHSIVREKYEAHYKYFTSVSENSTENLTNLGELSKTIDESLKSLPPNCQLAFRLSRYEHLSIADIADRMQLSTGTVENYITSALKHLREVLGKGYAIRKSGDPS